MKNLSVAFFGTPHYSLLILESLFKAGFSIPVVITKPPRPIGRKQELTPTPVALWAQEHQIPTLTPLSHTEKPWLFSDEDALTHDVLSYKPDILISADYTQKIPQSLIQQIPLGGLNVHPSLLPDYRGPAPIPWALLNGETETGVSIVTLADKFDQGLVTDQAKESILPTDTTDSLLTRSFIKGSELLIKLLPTYNPSLTTHNSPLTTTSSYYPRLTRKTGFEPWEKVKKALEGEDAERIERKYRALHPWPGLWTKISIKYQVSGVTKVEEKRLKILKCHIQPTTHHSQLILDEVQFEGKQTVRGKDVENLLRSIE